MNLVQLKRKLHKTFSPHYIIIEAYFKRPIGCTCGRSGKMDVLAEEPGCTFKRVSRKRCPICKGEM